MRRFVGLVCKKLTVGKRGKMIIKKRKRKRNIYLYQIFLMLSPLVIREILSVQIECFIKTAKLHPIIRGTVVKLC